MISRHNPRFRVDVPLSFLGDKEGEGTVLELSKSGCQIKTAVSLEVGNYLALNMGLPGQSSPMNVEVAVVRWAREGQFGVVFIICADAEQTRLRQYLQALPALSALDVV